MGLRELRRCRGGWGGRAQCIPDALLTLSPLSSSCTAVHLASSRLVPVPARAAAPGPAPRSMSEGVDLIDIYAEEEFNQVSSMSCWGALRLRGRPSPSFYLGGWGVGEATLTTISLEVHVERSGRCDWCAWGRLRQPCRVPLGTEASEIPVDVTLSWE